MDRPGIVATQSPTCVGMGSADVLLADAWLKATTPEGIACGDALVEFTLDELELFVQYPDVEVYASALASADVERFTIVSPEILYGISGTGAGDPGTQHLLFGEVRHKLGSSGAGASFTQMIRVHPTTPVVEYDSQGTTNSDVVSAVPVLWLDAVVSNIGASILYMMCFDATSVPPNGTLPLRQPTLVGAAGQTYIDLGDPGADGLSGRATLNGLVWAASTTATTLTVDTTNSLWVTARTVTL